MSLTRSIRWCRFPITAAAILGLVAMSYPGGLSAAAADLRDYGRFADEVREAGAEANTLAHRGMGLSERISAKIAVAEETAAGRLTLAQATEQFVLLNADDRTMMEFLHRTFDGSTVEEKTARNVIEFVTTTAPVEKKAAVRASLEQQFRNHYGQSR